MKPRFTLLVQMPNEKFPTAREHLNSFSAAMATLREWTSVLKAEGFKCASKPRPNKKMWFFRGDEVVTIHLRFTHTDLDVRRSATKEGLTLHEKLLE